MMSTRPVRYAFALALPFASAIPSEPMTPFCQEVYEVNKGCDATCGFVVNKSNQCAGTIHEPLLSPYCLSVARENMGCCKLCGNTPGAEGVTR